MMRWLGIAAVSAGLTLAACGSSEKKKTETNEPGFVAAPAEQALPGRWSDGSNTLSLDAGGTYRWEETRSCGAPPCPTTSTGGKWSLRNGKIYLSPAEGGDEVFEFGFQDNQKGLSLSSNKQNKSWSLRKQ